MAIRLNALKTTELSPRIVVFGVGGAGGNAVNNMIDDQLQGVDFVVANTDSQALVRSKAERRVQIGINTTQGLGAGANPNIGMAAAEESQNEIMEHLGDAHMVFITAGMGGGTGTGAAPIIARVAREMGILTVAVVTKPFHFEGPRRMSMADAGLAELQKSVDTLIVIPNQNLFRVANEKTTFQAAFQMADEVLHSGVRGITDLMIMPGLINLDFADVKSVMSGMGKAMMGTGEASGDNRATAAANAAINNPLLEDVSLEGAQAVLINITGGYDMTLFEFDEAANQVKSKVDPNANIIVGSTFDETMEGKIRVSVVASGIEIAAQSMPTNNSFVSKPAAPKVQEPVQVVRVSAPQSAPIYNTSPASSVTSQQTNVNYEHIERSFQPEPSIQEPVIEENSYENIEEEAQVLPPSYQTRPTQNTYAPAQKTYAERPVRAEAPAAPRAEKQHSLLNIFGKPKARPTLEAEAYTEPKQPESSIFDDEISDDYSIPAFLRRQAN